MPATTPGWIRWDPIGAALVDLDPAIFDGAAEGLEAVANTLQSAVNILALVEGLLASDPASTALSAIVSVLEALMNDIEGTDIYFIPHLPHSWGDLLHPYTIQDVALDLNKSVADILDPSRPIFDAGAAFASTTFIVGADNWMDFRRLLKLLTTIFSDDQVSKWTRLADIRFKFDTYQRRPVPRAERGSQGETWDWSRTNWTELVPPVGDALRSARDFAEGFNSGVKGLSRGLSEVTYILQERVAYIRTFLEEFSKLAAFLANLKEIAPEFAVLPIVSQDGGTNEFTRTFYSSLGGSGVDYARNGADRDRGGPQFKLCAGFTLFTGTGNPLAYFRILKTLLGLQVPAFESFAANVEAEAQNL